MDLRTKTEELRFSDGPLAGLKLIGSATRERRSGGGRNVTFPARQYSVTGERRSFALLRPVADAAAQDRLSRTRARGVCRERSGSSRRERVATARRGAAARPAASFKGVVIHARATPSAGPAEGGCASRLLIRASDARCLRR
jgi:hypothetical protein